MRALVAAFVIVVGGCSGVPLAAHLDAPVGVAFEPGVGQDSFLLFEDGPDDDEGILESYRRGFDDATAITLSYRRENRASGGRVYVSVQQGASRCECDIPTPAGNVVAFDNACGRGVINIPHL